MNIMNRLLRLALALALAGAIAMQIPSRGGVAIADDTYGGSGGGGARTLIQATVFALVGYGIYATATGQGGPSSSGSRSSTSGSSMPSGLP